MLASSFFAALLLPLIATYVLADDSNCTRTYTVKAGDICDSISAMNNVSTYQLAAVNPSIDAECDNLEIGQTLCLGTPGEDCSTTYVIKLNDECSTIAATNKINSTILLLNNPQISDDCTNIYVDEVLCVASTVIVPPGVASSTVTVLANAAEGTAAMGATSTTLVSVSDDDDELPWCEDEDDD